MKIIFIGSGISSLYCAYLLKRNHPEYTIDIYEKSHRIGGRIQSSCEQTVRVGTYFLTLFVNEKIDEGATAGREKKDKLLLNLLERLQLTPKYRYKAEVNHNHPSIKDNHTDLVQTIEKLNSQKHLYKRSQYTFKEYGIQVLGENEYQSFIEKLGHSDFEDADFIDTLDTYGFDDTLPGINNYIVPIDTHLI